MLTRAKIKQNNFNKFNDLNFSVDRRTLNGKHNDFPDINFNVENGFLHLNGLEQEKVIDFYNIDEFDNLCSLIQNKIKQWYY